MGSGVSALTGAYSAIDQTIAQFEGFGKPGTLATVNKNPGNIIAGDFATAHGATGSNAGFAVFPDVATGNAAQDDLVSKYINNGASLSDLISAWSPANAPGNSPSSTQNYINFAAGKLNVDPSQPLNSLPNLPTLGQPNAPAQSAASSNPAAATSSTGQKYNCSLLSSDYWMHGGAADYKSQCNSTNAATAASAFSFGRIGAFILGLIFIAGGIYLFKGTQMVIQTGGRIAGGVARVAAI